MPFGYEEIVVFSSDVQSIRVFKQAYMSNCGSSTHWLQSPSESYVDHVQVFVGQDNGMSGRVPLPNTTGWVPLVVKKESATASIF